MADLIDPVYNNFGENGLLFIEKVAPPETVRRRERAPACGCVCVCMRALTSCAARRHALGSALQGAASVRARRRACAAAHYAATCSAARRAASQRARRCRCSAQRHARRRRALVHRCWRRHTLGLLLRVCGSPRLCRSGESASTCTAPRCADRSLADGSLAPPPLLLAAAGARARSTSAAHSPRGVPPPPPSRAAARYPPVEARGGRAAEAFAPLALRARRLQQ